MKLIKYFALSFVLLLTGVGLSFAQVQVSLPDTTGTKPDTMLIPLRVSDLTGQNIYSAEFTIDYNPNVVQALGIQRSGTLSENLSAPAVRVSSGEIQMAFAEISPMAGSGDLVNFRFRLLPNASPDSTLLTFAHVLFNEGTPAATTTNGKIRLRAIHISPHQSSIYVGDSLQFSVSGTVTPPVAWSLTDPSVAQITAGGKLYAQTRGFTKVIATDNAGLSDTTANIIIESVQLRDLTLTVPDTAYTQTLTFGLPVYISDVTPLGIYSGQFDLHFDTRDLTFVGVDVTGTMIETWGTPAVSEDNGVVHLATAGETTLSGSGVFAYFRFRVKPHASGSSTVSVSDALFNEDVLANTVDGRFSVLSAPDIVITPSADTLTNGDTQQFSVSGGTGPYSWGSTNPGVATIDQSGFVTTHQSGSFRVFTQDAERFVDTTDVIPVNDLKVSLPDTLIQQGRSVTIPMAVDRDVTPFDVYSFEFSLAYTDTQYFKIDTVQIENTLSSSWGNIAMKDSAGTLTVAAAGTTPLGGQGVLLNIVVEDTAGAPLGTRGNFKFQRMLLNEGNPTATLVNGSIEVVQPQVEVHFSLPDTSAEGGTSLEIPVTTPDTFDTLNVTEYSFTVDYDANILFASGVNVTGTMSENFTVTPDLGTPGSIQVSANNATAMTGSGVFLRLQFDVLPEATGSSNLAFTQFQLNSGSPVAVTHDGNFTTIPTPPTIPDLASPLDGSTGISTNPTLNWHPSVRADSYQLQVSSANDFSAAVYDQSGLTDTLAQVGPLNPGITYYWRVSATNGQGSSGYSSVWNFSTTNHPPVAVNDTISIPEDSTAILMVLQNDSDPDGNTITISGLDTVTTYGTVSINSGDTSLTYVPVPDYSGADSFRYSIEDGHGGTDQATVYITITPVNDPPSAFSLVSPADSTEIYITNDNLSDHLTFEWTAASDVDNDSVVYSFQVETGNLTIIAFNDTGSTTVPLTYQDLFHSMDLAGVSQVAGDWTILASDGQDTTYASGGPRYLFIDASTVDVADEHTMPLAYHLDQNYPNPFNPTTTIEYSIPKAGQVRIAVFDILGNRIKTLVNSRQQAGRYTVSWNGVNDEGREVSTGIYFYRIRTRNYTSIRKMVFEK